MFLGIFDFQTNLKAKVENNLIFCDERDLEAHFLSSLNVEELELIVVIFDEGEIVDIKFCFVRLDSLSMLFLKV